MTLRLNGSTSGYTEIDAPAVAGSNKLVLPTGNGSAHQILKNGATAGSLEYGPAFPSGNGTNGQFLQTDGSGTLSWAAAISSKVLQVVQATKTDTFTSTSTGFTDITGISVSITPSSASNKVLVLVHLNAIGGGGGQHIGARLVRGSTVIYTPGDGPGTRFGGFYSNTIWDSNTTNLANAVFLDSPATTSSTTYKVQAKTNTGTFYVNRSVNDADQSYTIRGVSSITAIEVAA